MSQLNLSLKELHLVEVCEIVGNGVLATQQ